MDHQSGYWYFNEDNSEWIFIRDIGDEKEETDDQEYADEGTDSDYASEYAEQYLSDDNESEYYEERSHSYDDEDYRSDPTLVVYDWDDTLLPTTVLDGHGYDLSISITREIRSLERRIIKLLKKSLSLATVKIVTNAGAGWAEMSCKDYMPSLSNFLNDNEVEIISASSECEDTMSDTWDHKTSIFLREARKFLSSRGRRNGRMTFVSIGDSAYEQFAAQSLYSELGDDSIKVKILSLDDNPTISTTQTQVDTLSQILEQTIERDGFEDFSLE